MFRTVGISADIGCPLANFIVHQATGGCAGLIAWARSDWAPQAFLFPQTPQTPRIDKYERDKNTNYIAAFAIELANEAGLFHPSSCFGHWVVSLPSGRFSVGPEAQFLLQLSFPVALMLAHRTGVRTGVTPPPPTMPLQTSLEYMGFRTQRRDEWEQKMFVRLFREQFSV
jgi:hypothetical protein